MILKYKDKTLGGGSNAPVNATYLVNAPIGAIIVWSGTEDSVPQGWSICNGENGTLDLRDKFVLGAGTGHSVGDVGGSEEVKLTIEQMPTHRHQIYVDYGGNGNVSASIRAQGIESPNEATIANYTANTGSSRPHPNMPPYYTALYIQKTGPTPSDYATEERVQEIVEEAIANTPTVEEYDTADGWHVRKHSDGYVEMFIKKSVTIDGGTWGPLGALFSHELIPNGITYPFKLKTLLQETCSLGETRWIALVVNMGSDYSESDKLSKTNRYAAIRWDNYPSQAIFEPIISVFGRWK